MYKAEDEETDVIEAVCRGETQSYGLLVAKYKKPLFNLAFRMTGSYEDADDLAQESFMRAFQALHRFDRKKPFFTWLYTITLNLIKNHLKRKGRVVFEEVREDVLVKGCVPDEGSCSTMAEENPIAAVETCMQKLPHDLREALVLRFYQDLPFDAVAEILHLSLSAAKMRVYRGLERLREMMEEEAKESEKSKVESNEP